MLSAAALSRQDAPEARNSSALGLDERDQPPELRQGAEPLDILKWELEALKFGRDLEKKENVLADEASWERVQSVRSALAAEIEVRKKEKPGPWKLKDKKPPVEETQAREAPPSARSPHSGARDANPSARDAPPSARYSRDATCRAREALPSRERDVPSKAREAPPTRDAPRTPTVVGGTVDNPIPLTKSLEQPSKAERKTHAFMERRPVVAKFHTDRKPPLPPRSRPLAVSPPPVKQSMFKLASSRSQPQKPSPSIGPGIAKPEPLVDVVGHPVVLENPLAPNSIEPIIIETLDPVPGAYNVPIFVDDGHYEDTVVIDTFEPVYGRATAAPPAVRALEEQSSPIYRTSSPVKSAYALNNKDPAWPDELKISTNKARVNVVDLLTKMYSVEAAPSLVAGDHVDLSQMDADELEEEYALLVSEKGLHDKDLVDMQKSATLSNDPGSQDMTERQASSNDESTVFPLVGTMTKEDNKNEPGDDEANDPGEETIIIIAPVDETPTPKLKPLDELRQKCMVIEASSGEEDLQSMDGVKMTESGQLVPVAEESEDEAAEESSEEAAEVAPDEEAERGADQPTDNLEETRDEPVDRSSSIGQEPPETPRQYYSRSKSYDHGMCSTSEALDEESFGSIDEDYSKSSKTDDCHTPSIEHGRHFFASKGSGRKSTGRLNNRGSSRKKGRSDYDFPSIESVVAEYFGARKNRLTENGTGHSYKSSVFADTSRGCCMAFP